jgi:hypothetical protein
MSLDDGLVQVQDFIFAMISFNMTGDSLAYIWEILCRSGHFFFFLSLSVTRMPSNPPRWMVLLAGNFFISFYRYSVKPLAIRCLQHTLIPCADYCNRIYCRGKQLQACIARYHIQSHGDTLNSGGFCPVSWYHMVRLVFRSFYSCLQSSLCKDKMAKKFFLI